MKVYFGVSCGPSPKDPVEQFEAHLNEADEPRKLWDVICERYGCNISDFSLFFEMKSLHPTMDPSRRIRDFPTSEKRRISVLMKKDVVRSRETDEKATTTPIIGFEEGESPRPLEMPPFTENRARDFVPTPGGRGFGGDGGWNDVTRQDPSGREVEVRRPNSSGVRLAPRQPEPEIPICFMDLLKGIVNDPGKLRDVIKKDSIRVDYTSADGTHDKLVIPLGLVKQYIVKNGLDISEPADVIPGALDGVADLLGGGHGLGDHGREIVRFTRDMSALINDFPEVAREALRDAYATCGGDLRKVREFFGEAGN
jgi:hypothetical protein